MKWLLSELLQMIPCCPTATPEIAAPAHPPSIPNYARNNRGGRAIVWMKDR